MRLVLIHGWGFNADVWDDLAAHLNGYALTRIELGFFTDAPFDVASQLAAAVPADEPAILIGHSLGFIEGMRLNRRWAGLVAINSFARFVTTPEKTGCVSAMVLREMQRRLTSDVRATLDGFYTMIDAPSTVGVPNPARLQAGLDALRDADVTQKLVDGALQQPEAMPSLVLASRNDPLVPMDASEALAFAANSPVMWHNTAGHMLPLRDAAWCAERIKAFADRLTPVMVAPEIMTRDVAQRFDKAAPHYDQAARMQLQVAQQMVAKATINATETKGPLRILDMGCGTGFVAQEVLQRWPNALVTAVDPAPAMLAALKERLPQVEAVQGDADSYEPEHAFDAIFSSMMLHWLPEPMATLKRWQGWLKPGGKIYAAFLGPESFREWQALCANEGMTDGLWPMPVIDAMAEIADEGRIDQLLFSYASAAEFLRGLKQTGAAMPKAGHKPMSAAAMRWLLKIAPQPFPVTYQVISLTLPAAA